MVSLLKGKFMQRMALYMAIYAALIIVLWVIGGLGPRFSMGAIVTVILSAVPAIIVSIAWFQLHLSYQHEDPTVERLRKILQAEKLQSEAVIDAIDDGIMIIGKTGMIRHANGRVLEMLASTEQEILNKPYSEMVNRRIRIVSSSISNPGLGYNIAEGLRTGKPIYIEHERVEYLETKTFLDLSISLLPLKNEDGELSALLVVGHDITSLITAQKVKDEFVATASHELRTPVTEIGGYLDLLLTTANAGLSEGQRHYVQEAKASTNNMAGLVNDMIDMTTLESGNFPNNPQLVQLDALINQIIEDTRQLHNDKYIKTTVEVAVRSINVDKQRIELLLKQIIDNAFKFTPDKGTVSVRVVADGSSVVFEIADNGLTIPDDKRASIFEKFTKLDATGAISGTGLGLAISKKITDEWGGTIEFSNPEAGGVLVVVAIPGVITDAPVQAFEQPQTPVSGI